MKRTLLIPALILAIAVHASAQSTDTTSRDADPVSIEKFVLRDGSEFVGHVVDATPTHLRVMTLEGMSVDVPIAAIQQRIAMVRDAKGRILRPDPNRTRLLFTSTGYSLKKGEGYFALYEVFFPMLAVGITDNVSLAGGMSLFPGLDITEQLFYGNLKFGIVETERLGLSVGVLYGTLPFDGEGEGAGLLYTVASTGGPLGSLTFGGGLGFSGGSVSGTPVILIGGDVQVSNSVKLISENYIFAAEDGFGLISGGIRFFGDKLAADLGFFVPVVPGMDAIVPLPWVNFAYKFGG